MTHAAIVGGGPAGLSAALFLAKNDVEATVFDTDDTWMHTAHLFNYPGIGSQGGTAFLETLRDQVDSFGATREQGTEVTGVTSTEDGFVVTGEAEDGEAETEAEYLILATGADRELAEDLGCGLDEEGVVEVDVTMETSVPDAYATGAMVRAEEWQAVISAGDGAAAALNILTKEKGEHFHDFDTPEDAAETFGAAD